MSHNSLAVELLVLKLGCSVVFFLTPWTQTDVVDSIFTAGRVSERTTCKVLVFTLFLRCLFLQYKATVTPWVGLRKINVSYWCWEDMSPFTNTTLQWLPGEPSDAGFCGYLAEPASSGLKAQTCINPVNGSLCERPGGFPAVYSGIKQ